MSVPAAQALYFVALLPDEQIQQDVTAFKQVAAEQFNSRHALKSPPHITIIPPFKLPAEEATTLVETMAAAAARLAPFPVQLRGFDRFGQRVIFVDVIMDEALRTCYQVTAEAFHQQLGIKPDDRPFHAHMTVAFKDLHRKVFGDAWAYFSQQSYERTFHVQTLTLLKHNGQRWEVEQDQAFSL
ncbi:2'-5' RNA ligase family protein [Telluribacter sp. SYSU D00476]|uniref:2'-5' RNA ligase family protein n=1 Tax=Telluribacter sp. SYSU D00476 TaxID=2811430 RepID=UPI001FF66F94|nr:2'-5' RNA ligase family protein [Telluribacter sp. SYSU D00476]